MESLKVTNMVNMDNMDRVPGKGSRWWSTKSPFSGRYLTFSDCAHNPEVEGSNPSPATIKNNYGAAT